MKKLLVLGVITVLSATSVFAQNSTFNTLKNSIKSDVQTAKKAVKQDIQNTKANAKAKAQENRKAQDNAAAQKKAEKIKQIDAKLVELNKELASVKADKTITETERTLRMGSIQKQINFYNKQKAALK